MDDLTKKNLKAWLRGMLRRKIDNYSKETDYMPFFKAIFTEEQRATASVIQSFYTSFGMSVYEQMSRIMAQGAGFHAETQYDLLGSIDDNTENMINRVHMELLKGKKANRLEEMKSIRENIKNGAPGKDPEGRVDVFVKKPDGEEYYFDISTVKPNLKEFRLLKRKLMRWSALRLSQNRNAKVNTAVVLPYNPYYPKPYSRWTKGELYDDGELLVGEEYWNFVGGDKKAYGELLEIFSSVGKEFKKEIEGLTG